jgi:flagellar basal-body rod protein FlgC
MSLPPISKPSGMPPTRPGINSIFHSLRIASSGMTANQFSFNVKANNVANMETTKVPGGGPYQRQVALIEAVDLNRTTMQFLGGAPSPHGGSDVVGGVRVAGVATDTGQGAMIYNPGHPDADAAGYVVMPNIDKTAELLGLADARDGFNANSTVLQAVSSMLRKGLKI